MVFNFAIEVDRLIMSLAVDGKAVKLLPSWVWFSVAWKRSIRSTRLLVSKSVELSFKTMIKDFDNIAFGNVLTMAVLEYFLHTKPSIGRELIFMLRTSKDYSEESSKRAGVKWLPLMANSLAVSGIVIAEPRVRATTWSAAHMGSSSIRL
ncbi:hypothetical protein Tco_0449586 [Tanacetum coccineum]